LLSLAVLSLHALSLSHKVGNWRGVTSFLVARRDIDRQEVELVSYQQCLVGFASYIGVN